MKMLKSKKGQGLPMNTIIIAILVLVVLVIVIAFFVGGTSQVALKIKQIFSFGTAGSDVDIGRNFCQTYCTQAQGDPDPSTSTYCTREFTLENQDKVVGCPGLGVSCPGVTC